MPDAVHDAVPDAMPKLHKFSEVKSWKTMYYEKEIGRDAWWKAQLIGLKWYDDEVQEEWAWNPMMKGHPPQATGGNMRHQATSKSQGQAPTPEPKAKSKAKAKAKGKTKAKAKGKAKAKAKSNGKGKAAKQGKDKGKGKGN